MGDKETLAKARRELEDLYLGVPDDSVNLTFQDLANIKQQHADKKRPSPIDPISEGTPKREGSSLPNLTKLPSLDFSKAFQQSSQHYNHHHHGTVADHVMDPLRTHHHHHHHGLDHGGSHASRGNRYENHHFEHASPYTPRRDVVAGFGHGVKSGRAYDDISVMSGTSMASTNPYQERGGRRRPGIPHSNICTICCVYIYIFRHRCLVCGRVYCRECVGIGMGEMSEGRKCLECLGRRFSQRYIQRAGKVGCCSRYPSIVKQQELKWAEKGPRRSGERGYGRSTMMSRSRSPMTPSPRTPTRAQAQAHTSSNPPSFVMNSPYSAYSPTNHPLPF